MAYQKTKNLNYLRLLMNNGTILMHNENLNYFFSVIRFLIISYTVHEIPVYKDY